MAIVFGAATRTTVNFGIGSIGTGQIHGVGAPAGTIACLAILDWNGAASSAWTIPAPSAGENTWVYLASVASFGNASVHFYTRDIPQGQVGNGGTFTTSTGASQVGITSIHWTFTGSPISGVGKWFLDKSETRSPGSGSSVTFDLPASTDYVGSDVECLITMGNQLNSSFGGSTGRTAPTWPAGFTVATNVPINNANNAGQGFYHQSELAHSIPGAVISSPESITYGWAVAATQRPHMGTARLLFNPTRRSTKANPKGMGWRR